MNERIREKIDQKLNKGAIIALLDNHGVKEITERIWLMLKLAKKLHWISHDHYFAGTKAQAFAVNLFSKHTTKRDVHKFVKQIKANSKVKWILYQPCNPNIKSPHTWTRVEMSEHDLHFTNRWIKQLNKGCILLFGQANAYYSLTDYKKFLKQIEASFKKMRKQSEAKKRAEA